MQLIDISPWEHGLKQCFVDKIKSKKKDIAVKFETFCSSVDKDVSPDDKENFHDFLRSATNTFSQNIYRTKDSTWNLLRPLQRNQNIVLLSGDKDLSVITLDKACYKEKINRLINDGISKRVCVIEENDNSLSELKSFQKFIYRNIKTYEKYRKWDLPQVSQLDFLLLWRRISLEILSKWILMIWNFVQ